MDNANDRGRLSEARLMRLAAHLTERDRQIALDCYEHHVFTTQQLARLHFTSGRTGRQRLLSLYELRVLDRFRPRLPLGEGSAPYHWVLDEAGAYIVATDRGHERRELRWQHARALSVARSAKLAHHIEVNELVTRLARDARQAGGALAEWYGERTLCDLFDGALTPDSYCVLALRDRPPAHLLVELDRGTEPAERLREKATRYAEVLPDSPLAETNPLVILAVPSPARARIASSAVAGSGAPILVTVWSSASSASLLRTVTTAATGTAA